VDGNDRQVIEGLFDKLRQVDSQAPARDAEAERLIRQQIESLPAAPYYMAQAIVVQEQALASLHQRIQELERQATEQPAGGGGFLSGLFGTGSRQPAPPARVAPPAYAQQAAPQRGPWGGGGGGGFMAGAMQTALGVAGGMLIADALASAFGAGAAEAAALPPADEPLPEDEPMEEPAFGDEEW
jgi:hypothetical protein